jgi:hypothetical protein
MANMANQIITAAQLQTMNNIMASGQRGVVLAQAPGAMYGPGMDAAGAATGMSFLVGELEKQDNRLLEPLTSITAPRDIMMKAGGGWVANTSNVFVDYATTGNDEDAIIAGETTNIPVSQANISKDVYKVMTFAEILRAPLFDDLKLQQIGRSLTTILDDGLRLNFNKLLDRNVYVGITKSGTYGLLNNPNIAAALVANNAGATSRLWVNKTPAEILKDVNEIVQQTWADSEYDLTGMANQILIDPANYAYIVNQPVTLAGDKSILEYLLQNNIAKNQGRDLKIFPSRWCIGAGATGTNRMLAYVNAENRVNMDLTVPLSRVMTAPNVQSASYETLYAAQIGQVKFLYTQCARYGDGI